MKCHKEECLHYSEDFVKFCSRWSVIKLTDCPDYMNTKKQITSAHMAGPIKASAWYLAKPVSPRKGELIGSFRTKREAMTYKTEGKFMDYIVRNGKDLKTYNEGIAWQIHPKVYLHSLQSFVYNINELTSKN